MNNQVTSGALGRRHLSDGFASPACCAVEVTARRRTGVTRMSSRKRRPKSTDRCPFGRLYSQHSAPRGHRLRILADRSLANRILADRSLANRSCRRRRLLAGQIGGGGCAQHGHGCSRNGQNLQHDYSPSCLDSIAAETSHEATEGCPPCLHHHWPSDFTAAWLNKDDLRASATQ